MRIAVNSREFAEKSAKRMAGNSQAVDSYTKNIQRQIANARERLQSLSENEEISLEEKMKRRQDIQKQITELNNQLRQHQIEQRKEQQKKEVPEENKREGSMEALISADASMKQAEVSGRVASNMEGRARVLKTEIKQDAASGADTQKKEQELADVEETAGKAAAASGSLYKEPVRLEISSRGVRALQDDEETAYLQQNIQTAANAPEVHQKAAKYASDWERGFGQ